jgi:CheY-like chemotaxis protein
MSDVMKNGKTIVSSIDPGLQELEDAWRARLEDSRRQCKDASNRYRTLLAEERDGRAPRPDSTLARARQAQSEALMEYARVLRLFTDLVVLGKMPEETLHCERTGSKEDMIAVIDDDESIRDSTNALLRSAGHKVRTFASAELFLDSDALAATECIILDVRMPGMDGLELQRRLRASHADIPIIFVTAHDDASSRHSAMAGGAIDFLSKPFQSGALEATVQAALTCRALRARPASAPNGDR